MIPHILRPSHLYFPVGPLSDHQGTARRKTSWTFTSCTAGRTYLWTYLSAYLSINQSIYLYFVFQPMYHWYFMIFQSISYIYIYIYICIIFCWNGWDVHTSSCMWRMCTIHEPSIQGAWFSTVDPPMKESARLTSAIRYYCNGLSGVKHCVCNLW